MGLSEGFPPVITANERQQIMERAQELVSRDRLTREEALPPIPTIDRYTRPTEGPEASGVREPRRPLMPSPAGAMAVELAMSR